ncbi:MAG: glycosyltransferase [Clostridia bacterium]|nr:glycosyltransferase [Clostridia bacterium]
MMEDWKLGWNIEKYNYFTSSTHTFMGVGEGKYLFDNIGEGGENLTVAVLSMNRSSLTIRLMNSIKEHIPDFKGEFLIGDNGSEEAEKAILRYEMERMPYRCRMVEFDANYGVAGGRNRLFCHAKTDWILSLDNDIYFVGNPLPVARKNIAQIGCHFLCMPLINYGNEHPYLWGGHMYVDRLKAGVDIGGGSVYIQSGAKANEEFEPSLCTFMPGGTCIFNKHTFYKLDGYDDNMFVGFEDTEFSIRVFQAGYKIAGCGIASLVHNHPKPENNNDKNYEKQRFSNTKLLESARYFERKHGVQVWNPMVEEWVNTQLREILDEEKAPLASTADTEKTPAEKRKVLLVVDARGWALDNIAHQIIRHCSDAYSFEIIYLSDIDNVWAVFLAGAECDIIHFLWRPWCSDYKAGWSRDYAARWGIDPDEFYKKYVADKTVTVSVYDHLFIDDNFIISERLFTEPDSPVRAYSVSSNILKEIYDADDRIRLKPHSIITDGVDLGLFKPKNLERFHDRKPGDKLTVGWAGNSMWSAEKEDFKGLHTLLRPVVEELQREGYPIELKLCDSNVKKIPHSEMPDYYASIDLYVCMSKIEGTPNPILECSASGVPFVSTRVGIVPEVAGPLQSKFILEERSRECLKAKLLEILNNPAVLASLSQENLKYIESWSWEPRAKRFIALWDSV